MLKLTNTTALVGTSLTFIILSMALLARAVVQHLTETRAYTQTFILFEIEREAKGLGSSQALAQGITNALLLSPLQPISGPQSLPERCVELVRSNVVRNLVERLASMQTNDMLPTNAVSSPGSKPR